MPADTAPPADALDVLRQVADLLARLQGDGGATAATPELIDRSGVAQLLGIGLTTLDQLERTNQIPAPIELGGSARLLRWSRSELISWCRSGCPPRARWAPIWRQQQGRRAS